MGGCGSKSQPEDPGCPIEGQLKAYPTDLYTDAEVSAELHTLLAAAKTRE